MAYAAVISLKNTIERLLNSSRISIVSPSRKIIEFAYIEVKSLQEVLERLDSSKGSGSRKRVNDLDGQIRDAVYEFEDLLESYLSDQILSESESLEDKGLLFVFSLDLQELRQDIDCFTRTMKKIEEEYVKELDSPLLEDEEEEGDDDDDASLRTNFDGKESEMVGFTVEFQKLRSAIVSMPVTTSISIVGMAGIGKTTFAKKIFEDPLILNNFDCRAFVKMGQKYQLKEIIQFIATQVDPDSDKTLVEGDEHLDEYFCKSLKDRKYLIVLDDVWDADFWDDFIGKLPEDNNGSLILLTTRLLQVGQSISTENTYTMRFLNKEESWDLFRWKVFAEEMCPPQLEKDGKKIAENCEGLPLLILTVADLLLKVEKTPEYWNKLAMKKENSIFIDAYDQISKVLCPSYNYLPRHLKACFLYMGAFPQNDEVRRSTLINLWSAEGFLEPNPSQSLEDFARECFRELVYGNVVVVRQRGLYHERVKSCSLHFVYWHLCKKKKLGIKSFFIS